MTQWFGMINRKKLIEPGEKKMENNNQNIQENTQETIEKSMEQAEENMQEEAELTREEFEEMLRREKASGRGQGVLYTLIAVAIIAIIISTVVSLAGISSKSASSFMNDTDSAKADYLWKMVEKYYLWESDADPEAAKESMYKGMLDSLGDPYSVYYTKDEFNDLIESSNGEYSGIGAYISQDPDTKECYIARPMPGSPAEESGVKANDYIYEIDGEEVLGQDLNIIVSKIKGPEGTNVKIGFKHENQGEIDTIEITRRTIEVQMTEYEMLEDKIGYIWIYEFEKKTNSQFDKAFEELKQDGMEGLIIDLRDNPGGDLDVVVKLCDKFLDEGIIVYTKNKNGKGETFKSDAACEKLPIVILTNENSASASEIFTGSLKDRGVATVVGTKTFGKGIVQSLFALKDGSGVKVTESEYYLPNDECIHGVGIEPDYEVELDYEAYYKDKTDAQKDKAIEVMKGLIK